MLRLVTLLCLAVAVFGTPFQGAPRQNGRIVGGDPVDDIADFPYQLSLFIGGFFECGAVIISPLWAVTAAQCAGGSVANMQLRAGSVRHSGDMPPPDWTEHKVVQKTVHLGYNPSTSDNDIAVLKVDSSTPFVIDDNSIIKAVPLPATTEVPTGDGTVLGWGLTTAGGIGSDVLRSVVVPFITNEECQTAYGNFATVTARMICTLDPEGGKDACQGDSGGPLVNDEGKLFGIVSWGRGCASADSPGVYTSVPALRNWILANTGV